MSDITTIRISKHLWDRITEIAKIERRSTTAQANAMLDSQLKTIEDRVRENEGQ